MTELPHVDSFDPEHKDGIASPSTSQNSTTTNSGHKEARPTEPVELNMGDPHFMANAYDTYANLRAKGPVSRVRFASGAEEAAGEKGRSSAGSSVAKKPSSSPTTTR